MEAKFHEEKLKLQQKHDTDVQKVGNITYSLIYIEYLKYCRYWDLLIHPSIYVFYDSLCYEWNLLKQ